MAMSFEESLQAICNEILPEDVHSYNKDINKIRYQLLEKMMHYDVDFKIVLDDLNATAHNIVHLENGLSDEFDFHMRLRLPFPIKSYQDFSHPGLVILTTPTGTIHSLVRQDRISRQRLQDWIRNILLHIIDDGLRMRIDGRSYMITYPPYGRGYDVAHTILAKELRHGQKRNISFDLIPAFELDSSVSFAIDKSFNEPLLAVPFGKRIDTSHNKLYSEEFTFRICAANREYMAIYDRKSLRDSLRLLKSIRDVKNLNLLTNSMIKCVYLDEIQIRSSKFWKQPTGAILIEMLEALMQALCHKRLPFYHDKRFKNLKLLRNELFQTYPIQLNLILKNLKHFQKSSKCVNKIDLAAFSYARNNSGHNQSGFLN